MGLVRMKALQEFSRNVGGQIVHGDPEHPDEAGRFPLVTAAAAVVLEDEGLAEPYSEKQQAKDEAAKDKGSDEGRNPQGARTSDIPGNRQSAQAVRDARTNTNTVTATGAARRKPRGGKQPTAGEAGGASTGGHDTNASTNHPSSAANSDGTSTETNDGASADPDAAPTE